MSHFLTIPINANGIILDRRFKEELQIGPQIHDMLARFFGP
jgi:hypothetical protein